MISLRTVLNLATERQPLLLNSMDSHTHTSPPHTSPPSEPGNHELHARIPEDSFWGSCELAVQLRLRGTLDLAL